MLLISPVDLLLMIHRSNTGFTAMNLPFLEGVNHPLINSFSALESTPF